MRMRGRRLVRVAATTAVVAGTAGAVSHHQQQKYANQDQQYAEPQQQYAPPPQEYAPPPAAAAPAAPVDDLNSQLMQLSQLHNAGVLSDEEFTAAKAKLISG